MFVFALGFVWVIYWWFVWGCGFVMVDGFCWLLVIVFGLVGWVCVVCYVHFVYV